MLLFHIDPFEQTVISVPEKSNEMELRNGSSGSNVSFFLFFEDRNCGFALFEFFFQSSRTAFPNLQPFFFLLLFIHRHQRQPSPPLTTETTNQAHQQNGNSYFGRRQWRIHHKVWLCRRCRLVFLQDHSQQHCSLKGRAENLYRGPTRDLQGLFGSLLPFAVRKGTVDKLGRGKTNLGSTLYRKDRTSMRHTFMKQKCV